MNSPTHQGDPKRPDQQSDEPDRSGRGPARTRMHPRYGERPQDGAGGGFAGELGLRHHEQGPEPGSATWEAHLAVASQLWNAGLGLPDEACRAAQMQRLFAVAAGIAGLPGAKPIKISFDLSDPANPGTRLRAVVQEILGSFEAGARIAEPESQRLNPLRWSETKGVLLSDADSVADLNDSRASILVALAELARRIELPRA